MGQSHERNDNNATIEEDEDKPSTPDEMFQNLLDANIKVHRKPKE
jgi:hypothetical protein